MKKHLLPLLVLFVAAGWFFLGGSGPDHKERALYEEAMAALDKGQDDVATQLLTRFLVKYPDSELTGEVLYQRGTIYSLYQKKYVEAVSDFRELMVRVPGDKRNMDAQRIIAEVFETKLGNCSQAIVEYQRLISNFDTVLDDDLYQLRIARCFYRLLNFEQSKLEYRLLIETYPASPYVDDSYFQIAVILQTQGILDEAVEAWRTFLARYPDGDQAMDARFNLAATLEEKEDLEEALEIYLDIFDKYENREAVTWRIEKVRDRLNQRKR